MFDLHQDCENLPYDDYVNSWKKAMQEAYAIAGNSANKNARIGKKFHDKKMFGATLSVEDRVLVRNLSERGGTGKLRSYWEKDVYVVIRKKDENIPVYTVKAENGKGKERVLHRNLLLSCEHLPLEKPVEKDTCVPGKKTSKKDTSVAKKTHKKVTKSKSICGPDWKNTDSSSEDEDQWINRCRYVADKVENLLMAENRSTQDGSNKDTNEEITEVISTDCSVGVNNDVLPANENEVIAEQDIDDESSSSDNNNVSIVVDDKEVKVRDYLDDESITVPDDSSDVESVDATKENDENSVDTEKSEESDSSPDENVEILNLNKREGSKRNRKPPRLFTYNEVGKPSYS